MGSIVQRGNKHRAEVRMAGFDKQCKTFDTHAEAKAWVTQTEAALLKARKNGEGSVKKSVNNLTISDYIAKYKDIKSKGNNPLGGNKDYTTKIDKMDKEIGLIVVEELKALNLIDWVSTSLDKGRGKVGLYLDLSILKTLLRTIPPFLGGKVDLTEFDHAQRILLKANMISPGGKRNRRPSVDELKRILDRLEGQVKDVVLICSLLGLRRTEATTLLWKDIDETDPKAPMILVRDRKHPRQKIGNDDWVPLIENSLAILKKQPKEEDQERIFTIHPNHVSNYFRKACKEEGIEDLHLHDLRHDAMSNMRELGMSLDLIMTLSGHKSYTHMKRYINLNPKDTHKAYAALKKLKDVEDKEDQEEPLE